MSKGIWGIDRNMWQGVNMVTAVKGDYTVDRVKSCLQSNKKSPVAISIQACISSIKPKAMKDYSRIS